MPSIATGAAKSSTDTTWRIEQACPQCGGAVVLGETDRLLCCPFCRVRLVLAGEAEPRYILPPRREDCPHVFVPYWRLKGLCFNVVPGEVAHAVVDRTLRAVPLPMLPATLGVRPQAMKLRRARPVAGSRFLRPQTAVEQAIAECGADCRKLEEKPVLDQCFLGTRRTLIYFPVRIEDGIWDGVNEQRIAPPGAAMADLPGDDGGLHEIRFLPALCPNCAGDLDAEPDGLVYLCGACSTAWAPSGNALVAIPCSTVSPRDAAAVHLPFWRLRLSIEGCALSNLAELVRFANLPRLPRSEAAPAPLAFWLPAFKLQPEHFLRLARTLTVAQPEEAGEAATPGGLAYPVTLAADQAAAALKAMLADLARPRPPYDAVAAGIRMAVEAAELVFLPFSEDVRELHHQGVQMTVARGLLEFGRGL